MMKILNHLLTSINQNLIHTPLPTVIIIKYQLNFQRNMIRVTIESITYPINLKEKYHSLKILKVKYFMPRESRESIMKIWIQMARIHILFLKKFHLRKATGVASLQHIVLMGGYWKRKIGIQ